MRQLRVGPLQIWLILALVLLSTVAMAGSQPRSEPTHLGQVPAAQQIAPAGAQAVLDTTVRDYGEVFAGEELDYPYNIFNAGTAPLELMQRQVSSRAAASRLAQSAHHALQDAEERHRLRAGRCKTRRAELMPAQ